MRYRHFLHPVKGEHLPGRVICLDVDLVYQDQPGRPGHQEGRLALWCSAGWDTSRAGVRRSHAGSGTTVASVWSALDWALRRPGQTLCVSWCASRVWGALELWERIERGEVRINGQQRADTSGRYQGSGVSELQGPGDGRAKRQNRRTAGAVPGVHECVQPSTSAGLCHEPMAQGSGQPVVIEDPPTVISVRYPGREGTLTIVDLRNWGVQSYPVTADCVERVRWGLRFVEDMIATLAEEGWGGLRLTGGSQASAIHRHSYLTHPIWIHTDHDVLDIEAGAFHGGRCECHRVGRLEGAAWHVDFRAAYCAVCMDCGLPATLRRAGCGLPDRISGGAPHPTGLIGRVKVCTDEPAYPLRRDDRVIYPVGTFITTLCGPELFDAANRGRVVQWHEWAEYDLSPCLREYARALYRRLVLARRNGRADLCEYQKLLLVALPGRFGRRNWTWRSVGGVRPPAPWCQWWIARAGESPRRARSIGWHVQVEQDLGWADDANLAIAAWITSEQRVRLLRAIRIAGWDELVYCDTDSLILTERGYGRLVQCGQISDGEPGRLRLLGRHQRCFIHGVKHYELDDVVKCSGTPAGRQDEADACGLVWLNNWIKGALARGQCPDVSRVLTERARHEVYRYRLIGDGGRTQPIRIGED